MALIKALLLFLGELFGFVREKQLIDAGKDAATGEQARETLETVAAVRAPITDAERNSVWERLQKQRAAERRLPADPGAGS